MGTLGGLPPGESIGRWLRQPETWGYPLRGVLIWAGVVLALYPACRRFAGVKARERDPWLSYV